MSKNLSSIYNATTLDIKIKKSLRNIPLAIFYTLLLIGSIFLFNYLGYPILIAPSILILAYFISRAVMGEAVVTLTKERVFLYAGVFSLGVNSSLWVGSLKSVYVNRISNGGDDSHMAKEIKQCIIFDGGVKINFIRNEIGLAEMKEYKDRIVDAILKFYDEESLASWNEYQRDINRENYH